MSWLLNPESWAALFALTGLEIVLGIDNIVFISILAGKLPAHQQSRGRTLGLSVAMMTRIGLLLSITWIMRLTRPLFSLMGHAFSGRDLILGAGGLFLMWKSTREIHTRLEGAGEETGSARGAGTFGRVLAQIVAVDLVFSLDSVITAVGMANQIGVMIAAIVIAVALMMVAAGPVSTFVDRHPTVKMLALSFLLLIGVALLAESFGRPLPKGYIYFAMAFSMLVEMLNLRVRKVYAQKAPVHSTTGRSPAVSSKESGS